MATNAQTVANSSAMIILGVDNGTSGSWGCVEWGCAANYGTMPSFKSLLGKKERVISRINVMCFRQIIRHLEPDKAYLERPFTGRFLNAVLPAQRAFEAVLISLEQEEVPYEVIDSKVWQKPLLGDIKGSANLKEASRKLGCQLYPTLSDDINKHGDADGLLIAHHFATLHK